MSVQEAGATVLNPARQIADAVCGEFPAVAAAEPELDADLPMRCRVGIATGMAIICGSVDVRLGVRLIYEPRQDRPCGRIIT
jgi:hypothetical protein